MRPEYFLIAAVVLIAIIALAKGGKKDKKARSIATQLPDLDQPSDVLTMRLKLPDGTVWPIDYCLDVQRAIECLVLALGDVHVRAAILLADRHTAAHGAAVIQRAAGVDAPPVAARRLLGRLRDGRN